MKTAGIIAEYNPFHKGHQYHIEQTKKVTGADYCVVVMSGDYVQRGTPSIMDKYTRTAMALEGGADLVLELPVPFAVSSAQIFAQSAVTLLTKTGCVDSLCFGSESASLPLLSKIAAIITDEPEDYQCYLQEQLRQGNSYPKSVYEAVMHFLLTGISESSSIIEEIVDISNQLSSPNNILGIEYLKALRKTGSHMNPYAIQRKGDGYHAQELSQELASASAIRNWSEKSNDIYGIRPYVPEWTFRKMQERFQHTFPVTDDDFSLLLNYSLRNLQDLNSIADVSPELADRIANTATHPYTFRDLADTLKTKNLTRLRINRCLLNCILGITKDEMSMYHSVGYCSYARILGFRKESSALLKSLKANSSVPIINKTADASSMLDDIGQKLLNHEILASDIYNQVVYHKFGELLPDEYRAGIVIRD